jgi:hypothetical protein
MDDRRTRTTFKIDKAGKERKIERKNKQRSDLSVTKREETRRARAMRSFLSIESENDCVCLFLLLLRTALWLYSRLGQGERETERERKPHWALHYESLSPISEFLVDSSNQPGPWLTSWDNTRGNGRAWVSEMKGSSSIFRLSIATATATRQRHTATVSAVA